MCFSNVASVLHLRLPIGSILTNNTYTPHKTSQKQTTMVTLSQVCMHTNQGRFGGPKGILVHQPLLKWFPIKNS